ncbi:MAG: YqgE/AlgH family protein [Ferrovum sp.]|jgi:putative transcriptional regulator|nr:YqgE/AlgH family protein [Ferrovum sp.]
MDTMNFAQHFLIAMPSLVDTPFSGTLTFICRHDESGAMGLVVNRPTDLTLGNLLGQMSVETTQSIWLDRHVFFGGPVQIDRGFVLHRPLGEWRSTFKVSENMGLTTSRDILESLGHGELEDYQLMVTLGYIGWSPGQLEEEMIQNQWLSVRANADIVFETPIPMRINQVLKVLGVTRSQLSEVVGHG